MMNYMELFSKASIIGFDGDYDFLSNFYDFSITFNGVHYKTSEHAYQAQKTLVQDEIDLVMAASTPGKAKRIAKDVTVREDWEGVKVGVMRDILWAKFSNEFLRNKLLETKSARLIEANNWGDKFWGMCDDKGKNMLGKLLMEIREEMTKPDIFELP